MDLEIREGLLELGVVTVLLLEVTKERLYLQVLIDFGDIYSERKFLGAVLTLPSNP